MKKFCPTHCFNYTGHICPYCENDRIASYAHRYVKKQEQKQHTYISPKNPVESDDPIEVTTEMLAALADKFNNNTFKTYNK